MFTHVNHVWALRVAPSQSWGKLKRTRRKEEALTVGARAATTTGAAEAAAAAARRVRRSTVSAVTLGCCHMIDTES